MAQYDFVKQVNLDKLSVELKNSSLGQKYSYITAMGTNVSIVMSVELNEQELLDLQNIVQNHTYSVTTQQLTAYLDGSVHPFVKNLINTFAAENISMGITQAGKTSFVLSLFSKSYDVYGNGYPFSLKNALDTGSLYEARAVIQHIRNNPSEFDGLAPYITDARLLLMKNNIETFLGLPLST